LVQVSSSSSKEHDYYLRNEVDFSDEPALPDTSRFLHISEEEMQVDVPAMVLPPGEVTTTEGLLLSPCSFLHMNIVLTVA